MTLLSHEMSQGLSGKQVRSRETQDRMGAMAMCAGNAAHWLPGLRATMAGSFQRVMVHCRMPPSVCEFSRSVWLSPVQGTCAGAYERQPCA